MKRVYILFLLIFTFLCVQEKASAQCNQKDVYKCATANGNTAIYLRDFNAKLQKSKKGEPDVAKFSVIMNKGTTYRLSVCDPEGFEGRSILFLYSNNKLLESTYNESTNQDQSFDFICKKSGTYYIFISYKKGKKEKKGCAVGILAFVKKDSR